MTIRGAPFLAWMLLFVAVGARADNGTSPSARTVRLYRDQYGMAHLYAEREEDGFYGLGYAIGEDRLRQVLAWYVAVRGELGATFGISTPLPYPTDAGAATSSTDKPDYFLVDAVATDRLALKYRMLVIARHNFNRLPFQFRRDLRSYVAGLRAYMRSHPEQTPTWAPPLEPALPLAMFHLMVRESHSVCDDRRRADSLAQDQKTAGLQMLTDRLTPFGGSNAWAVAGSRTSDGGVFLESDSHSPIETYGTLFYPYRIKAGALDFMAFDPAGSVMFFFGHSPYFAWGVTEGPRFVADCYRIKINPQSPQTFTYDGKTQKMTVVPYRIRIKGAPADEGVFEYTRHNGVLSPVDFRAGDVAYADSYISADRVGLTAGEYYRMAKARNRKQLEAALAQRDAYPANLVIAGADGTIMYIRPGRIPIRAPGVDVEHTLDGNTSATAWRGVHSYAQALKLINPPQGYVGNCNVSPDAMYPVSPLRPANYPSYYGFEPGHTNSRQQRLIELLDRASALSLDDAKAIAMDETIPNARAWARVVAQILAERVELLPEQSASLRSFMGELAQFDGTFSKDSHGALDYSELQRALVENHPAEEDTLSETIATGAPLTGDQERLLVQAAAEARAHIVQLYGRADQSWGDVHRVGRGRVDLPIGGARVIVGTNLTDGIPKLEASLRALNFRTEPDGRERLFGGQRIPFLVHFSPGHVQSYAETLFGVSDDPASVHYSDQARLASEKILRPIPLSEEALVAEHAAKSVLTVSTP